MNIEFNYSNDTYKIINEDRIKLWIRNVIGKENKKLGRINYSIVSDLEILEINQKHLNHDYFTDIITFDECFVNIINGDIFISLETVRTNSEKFNSDLFKEFSRVIIHGIMHLCGYNDHSLNEKEEMRGLEDKYLSYLEEL